MSFFPMAGRTGLHDPGAAFLSGPPADRAGWQEQAGCLDFPRSCDADHERVLIDELIREVGRIVDICRSGGDDRARAQCSFWDRKLAELQSPRFPTTAWAWAGIGLEELRWRHVLFSRRNDPAWRPLCARVEEYFELKEQLEGLLRIYQAPGETHERKQAVQERYQNLLAAIHAHLDDLRAERVRLTGESSGPSGAGRSTGHRPGRFTPAELLEPSAPPWSMDLRSRVTPTAPPMSASWFDEHGVVWPPTEVSGRPAPSSSRAPWRP